MISFWFKEIFQRVIYHQSSVTGKMRLISLIKRRIHRWLCCAGGIFCLLITKAYAENTVDVSFSAEMIPAACRVSLDNGGTVDYGTLSLSSIRSSSPYLLTPRVIGLHIQCERLRQVAWMVNDEKAETRVRNLIIDSHDDKTSGRHSSDTLFGLGVTSGQKPIGGYLITALAGESAVEGDIASWGYQTGEQERSMWQSAGTALTLISGIMRLTPVDAKNNPVAIRQLTIPLRISAAIASDGLSLQDETELQGEATISLIYL